MESVTQTPEESDVQQAILTVLQEQANALARSTGFIVRQLTGASFASLLILGWLQDPQASLDALVQFGSSLQVQISAQGLDQRFTVPAAVFFKALFEVALSHLIVADPVAIPLLNRFEAVTLEDSTSFGLPDELAGLFEGCGGSSPEDGLSACKLHLRYDARRAGLQLSPLQDGRAADCATPWPTSPPRQAPWRFVTVASLILNACRPSVCRAATTSYQIRLITVYSNWLLKAVVLVKCTVFIRI